MGAMLLATLAASSGTVGCVFYTYCIDLPLMRREMGKSYVHLCNFRFMKEFCHISGFGGFKYDAANVIVKASLS